MRLSKRDSSKQVNPGDLDRDVVKRLKGVLKKVARDFLGEIFDQRP
jgi:hypothetical protein